MTVTMTTPSIPAPQAGWQLADRTTVLHCAVCDTTVHVDRGEPVPGCETGHLR